MMTATFDVEEQRPPDICTQPEDQNQIILAP
jgi:hypothetical protein